MMAASLTLIKRPSLLPLPAKFRTLAPPPFPFHFPLPFSFISPNHYSSSPLSLDSYFSDNYTLHFSYDSEPFFASLINSSTHKTHLTQIHAQLLVLGFQASAFLITKLVNHSLNLGHITYARQVFDEFTDPGVFLWNAIVRGYSKHNAYADAVQMYCGMQETGVGPDGFTFPHVLKACGGLGAVEMGRRVHGQVFRHGFESDVVVQNSLVAFYAKCGRVDRARIVFDGLGERSIVSWTSIISGYAQNGECLEALRIFGLMRKVNVKPDWIVLVSVLKVYTDLLGRAGQLEQAYDFIKKMPIEPGTSVWGALLSSCKIHRNVTLGQYAAEKLLSLDPYEIGHYVQLSNLFASARLWDRVAQVRVLMREKGLIKGIGHSLIEINGKLQAFHVGDKSHPRSEEIYEELESLERRLKEAGFVPHTESVLHDLNYEETEETLCNHSERLAIVYGLISTAPGTTLRITKNIRGCVNCHAATKLISKLVNREIVVRDAKRFHHFKDGFCSCGDYW